MERNIGCLVCLDDEVCRECDSDEGFVNINGKCWKCPKGMKVNEGKCVFCGEKDGC